LNKIAWTWLKSFGIGDDQIENFTSQINSIETFFDLENMLRNKDYVGGYKLFNEYFAYFKDLSYLDSNMGMNLGIPVGTYGL
jgi:hypothetical protein